MQKVFSEAEEMAKRYKEQLPVISQNTILLDDSLPGQTLPFDDEATLYANWKWFKFVDHAARPSSGAARRGGGGGVHLRLQNKYPANTDLRS
jgi:small subunit ribosomal protein S1